MATKTIGQLTQATTINNADEFAIEQSGVTKRVAASVVRGDIVNANIKSDAAIDGSKLADASIAASKLNGAQSGSAPIYGCRAWVNFNGTRNATDTGASTNGANVLIRASGNVSSVLKNGQGDYTINFTTALPDANYAPVCMMSSDASRELTIRSNASDTAAPDTMSTTALRVQAYANTGGAAPDISTICIAIFR